ncbi:MAG: 5-(carboxyamino)imidazole ribonucleotide mutase [Actinobacteria bacterium]|nr:MAG: 5-(carboxyamino)imidazole ribonucleotide mutase [Actinomycetota bacterium]
MSAALVAVLMGSSSDYPVMKGAIEILDRFAVAHEVRVVSAHRTPHDMLEFAASAESRGLTVLIAGAGGAAHLPGMLASATVLPVIGVPIGITKLQGADSLLSIVQMPTGVPVATVAIDNARNAGLLAVRMLAMADARLRGELHAYADEMAAASRRQTDQLGSP